MSAPEFQPDDFARRFSVRAGNLMWLLGAGASAAGGIPTAADMIWEFKQQLYVSQRRVTLNSVADLSNAAVRSQLQSFIDSSGSLPADGSASEYAELFEAAWPDERDRRTYLDGKLKGGKPSYGHLALAALMKAGLTKLVWTTNFDPLVADACAKVYDGTGALTTVALDAPDLARQTITAARWPIEIKLHGDFRSRRLKNTSDELRQQDAKLRHVLVETCRTSGLVVVGYSGRDDSVMEALTAALNEDGAFPGGLFWLHRGEDTPARRVLELLEAAKGKGVDAGYVRIENFDEALRDLLRLIADLDVSELESFTAARQRWSAAPTPAGKKTFPVVRLNGLAVEVAPTMCRRVVCDIGGYSEVTSAIEAAGVDAIVGRVRAGVLAFGADADLRAAFSSFGIKEFDLHAIEVHRLRYDSGERGILREALSRAVSRTAGLSLSRHRVSDLLSPLDPNDSAWTGLREIVGNLAGQVPGNSGLSWREGVSTRLEWADDRLWLVFEPRTILDGVTDDNRGAAADFARERSVRRYNGKLNELVGYWAGKLGNAGAELRALDVAGGVDAVFQLSLHTAFSRRIVP